MFSLKVCFYTARYYLIGGAGHEDDISAQEETAGKGSRFSCENEDRRR